MSGKPTSSSHMRVALVSTGSRMDRLRSNQSRERRAVPSVTIGLVTESLRLNAFVLTLIEEAMAEGNPSGIRANLGRLTQPGTLAKCDPFDIPSTSHWTGVAIIVKGSRTTTCIVTQSRTSTRLMPSSLAG